MTKVASETFKRTLISTNWNYAATARRLGISKQAVQNRAKKIPRPREFINIEHRGPKMKISSPELRGMAIVHPGLRKEIALKETRSF